MSRCDLNMSRWLDAIWKPNAQIYALPNGMDMMDLSGDGDAKLIIVDLGNSSLDNIKAS
jgi:Bardet-Biedl syndrome 1 protein